MGVILSLCTWNVRSLVESFGDLRICRKRPGGSNVVDRKLDLQLLVGEIERYGVSIAAAIKRPSGLWL